MGGEVDYKDFYNFMHKKDLMKKFTTICCICQKDKNNVYYTAYSNGKKNLTNNTNYDYCFDFSIKRENNFIYEINSKSIDKLGDFLFNTENNCYHFYHENCKNKKIGCPFCYFGYTILNANIFCKMTESDFTLVIKKYKFINNINYMKKYFYRYKYELLNSAYSFIDNSKNIEQNAKESYNEKHNLEKYLKKKKMIKYDYNEETQEIALSEVNEWNNKLDEKLAKEREEKESRRKEIQDDDEDNDDHEENDEQEENEKRENNLNSSDSNKHEFMVNVWFCINCCRKKCVLCGAKWGNNHSVFAHESCNKNYRSNRLCGKCNKKCKPADYFTGGMCSNCYFKHYKHYKCYFCSMK